MKIWIFLLSFCIVLGLNQDCFGQKQNNKKACKALLKEVIELEDPAKMIEQFQQFTACKSVHKLDDFDLQPEFLQNALTIVLMRDEAATYKDLVEEVKRVKQTDEYKEARMIYDKVNILNAKEVDLKNWEKYKVTLLELKLTEKECKFLKKIFQDTLEQNPAVKINYGDLFELKRQKEFQLLIELLSNNDYHQGLAKARKEKKPVLLYFTGYGCANCMKMNEYALNNSTIIDYINENYVMITLYVDDREKLYTEDQEKYTELYGKKISSRGNLNATIQMDKFGLISQPYFVVVGSDEKEFLNMGYNPDAQIFMEFLEKGTEAK